MFEGFKRFFGKASPPPGIAMRNAKTDKIVEAITQVVGMQLTMADQPEATTWDPQTRKLVLGYIAATVDLLVGDNGDAQTQLTTLLVCQQLMKGSMTPEKFFDELGHLQNGPDPLYGEGAKLAIKDHGSRKNRVPGVALMVKLTSMA